MRESQKSKIGKHLNSYGEISPLEALNMFGCMRLSERIRELKADGMNILTRINGGRKKFAIYTLVNNQIEVF